MTAVWRTRVDWRARRPLLTRVTAHLTVLFLAVGVFVLSGVGLPMPKAAIGEAFDAAEAISLELSVASSVNTLPAPTPSSVTALNADRSYGGTVIRQPVLHTVFPDRPRLEVITYTIQPGDTIFDIAVQFNISPETIVWSNREVIQDAPWLIQPGLNLYILPTDGVYHTVREGETLDEIAAEYEVDPSALYNDWNAIADDDDALYEGQLLVVSGGVAEEIEWTPPPQYANANSSSYSYGVCSGVEVSGPGATGFFVLPTGSTRVSGWYFHDRRNPTHIGLDYGCHLGDPIYASDNGVVTISGWNGGYGNLVELNHGNGFVTRYAHFDSIIVGCGAPVYQGQLLGYCGTTGYSTGPHLHYEVRYQGVPQDPQAYLP